MSWQPLRAGAEVASLCVHQRRRWQRCAKLLRFAGGRTAKQLGCNPSRLRASVWKSKLCCSCCTMETCTSTLSSIVCSFVSPAPLVFPRQVSAWLPKSVLVECSASPAPAHQHRSAPLPGPCLLPLPNWCCPTAADTSPPGPLSSSLSPWAPFHLLAQAGRLPVCLTRTSVLSHWLWRKTRRKKPCDFNTEIKKEKVNQKGKYSH